MEESPENPFADLPEALVEEMLIIGKTVGENLFKKFKEVQDNHQRLRDILIKKELIKKDSTIIQTRANPTSCGIDGSYTIERLLSTDLVATAAVAVEGLTPPSEVRYWPQPRHLCYIDTINHSDSTAVVLRAIMICMELELANNAPHNVVLMDGSLTTPLIYLNQALSRIDEVPVNLSAKFMDNLEKSLKNYVEIILSKRSDKIYVGIPKYTTKKEISEDIFGLKEFEDRGLLSFILEAGEYISPLNIKPPENPWHISDVPDELKQYMAPIYTGLNNIQITYYRPSINMPVIRLEIPLSVSSNNNRLANLLEGIAIQCGAPAIFEPYPNYLADRMVKHLGSALPAIRKSSTQEIALKWDDNYSKIYFAMHGYRTID